MPPRFKVAITDFLDHSPDAELEILGDLARVECLCAQHEEELAGRIEDADAVMIYHCLRFTAKSIERLKQCKLIVRCGVGFDNVDFAAARARGIPVANVPDYGTEEVADSAIGMALSLARGISLLNSRLRASGDDWSYARAAPLPRLRSRVFAIIGLGRIGSAAALRAKALGMDVAYYDPYAPDGRDKSLGIRRVEALDDLLASAHIVSLHCPLTSETRHLINAQTLEKMPQGSYLVNTSRGGVVDTSAVPAAIASGRLAGAAIDVLEHEPPAADDPLIAAWRDPRHPAHHRLIVNPHAAFYCVQGLTDMRVKGAEACRRALLGLPLRNVVN
ncbi:MAG TPA: C-terminal binding protein [Pirellulales bacterium]|jgi:D-3-phosphoglycerate dehydrogenase/C-terminal binding protein|nr:C-terminal binding protein [Pirellulales bacterium]